jgi:hypothetical protein
MNARIRPEIGVLLALAIVAAACGSSPATATPPAGPTGSATSSAGVQASGTPGAPPTVDNGATPNASGDLATYAQIETQVEALRELGPKSPVTPVLLDEQGISDWMTRANQNGVDHAALAAQSRLFAHLGLLPSGASLEQLELALNAGQAVGFYDADTKQLYLLSQSGSVGPEQKLTFSHEFTHALQDQHFGLAKLAIDTPDQGDRDLARTALPEGDATLSMMQWALAHMSLADLGSVTLSEAAGPQTAQLNNAPAILREDLLFPYVDGLAFIESVYARGGWSAVDRLYARPPNSTSQILHPNLYSGVIDPVAVSLPAVPAALGSGWKVAYQDTMGELQLRVWLEGEHPTGAEKTAADSAASSWAGDRIGLYEGPNGAWAVVLRTQWRGASGRTAFAAAASTTLGALSSPSSVCGDALEANIVIASDTTVMGGFTTCRPAA